MRASKFSYDGEHFALVTDDAKLLIYDLRSILDGKSGEKKDAFNAAFQVTNYHTGAILTIDWSLTGKILATGGKDKTIKVNVLNTEYADIVKLAGIEKCY